MSDAIARALLDAASAPYLRAGRVAYYFARGKLAGDPVFRELLRLGPIPPGAAVLDLGCGRALLASWLLAAGDLHREGRWPADWPAPPALGGFRGIELMPRDVRVGRRALVGRHPAFEIVEGDIAAAELGRADVVTLIDVLHYLDFAAQEGVLRRVRDALPPGGRAILRIGDAAAGLPHRYSALVDATVAFLRRLRPARLSCRPLGEWMALLEDLGFAVRAQPLDGGPFANVMLIAHRPG